MGASLITLMKVLATEMYAEKRLKTEIIREALKSKIQIFNNSYVDK